MNLKQVFCLLALVAVSTGVAFGQKKAKAKADADTQAYRYEVEQTSVAAATGEVNLMVYGYSTKPAVAEEQTKKNAVHACIFKGLPAAPNKPGSQRKPLLMDAQQEAAQAAFFANFFREGGEYMRFVVMTGGYPKTMKMKKEYKVGVPVKVKYAELRKYLEQNKVIRSLTTGF